MKVLLTSTSFQDTPGKHQELLNKQDFEIDKLRGPLEEKILLPIIGNYDGIICGDDEITEQVIKNGLKGRLKIISKYGIGLDKIDLKAAEKLQMPVTNCPGVNHITVAEHTIGLMIALVRKIPEENRCVHNGEWKRITGNELFKKKLGLIGLGRIGREVAIRASAFGMELYAYDPFVKNNIEKDLDIKLLPSAEEVLKVSDVISFHMPLNEKTENFLNRNRLQLIKPDTFIINTARGRLINEFDMVEAINKGGIAGYAADVVGKEPIELDNPLIGCKNVILTPHIGSRTFESVERQGTMAVENLIKNLK